MNKIPVYYHIPKCGGTYILYLYKHLNIQNEKKYRESLGTWTTAEICRKAEVYLNETRYIEITGIIEIQDLLELNCELESYSNIFSIKKLYKLVDENKIKITSIFIQPTGDGNMMDSRNEVDKLISRINKQPVYFTTIRDVFDRLYSEYSYLNNQISSHEPFRENLQNYKNFEDFLIRSNDYDNIITRQIAYNLPLDDDSFKIVKDFFKNFTIETMQNLQETAIDIWQQCYGWAADCTGESFFKNENKNKKEIKIQDISDQAREHFLSKTEWDRKLYAYLSQT